MSRRDDVVIQEPPMEEFGKRHSCIKRTCLSGCGCFLLFVIGTLVLINFATRDHTKNLKNIPPTIQKEIPLYDTNNVNTIKFTSGKDQSNAYQKAAIVPKLFLAPFVYSWPEKFVENPQYGSGREVFIENMKNFLKRPVAKTPDTILLEWDHLSAEPRFVEEYYKSELKKKQFSVEQTSRTASSTQLLFQKEATTGAIFITDNDARREGTDYVSVKINMDDIEK